MALHLFLFCFLSRSVWGHVSALGLFCLLLLHGPPSPSAIVLQARAFPIPTGVCGRAQNTVALSVTPRNPCPRARTETYLSWVIGSSPLLRICYPQAPSLLLSICASISSLPLSYDLILLLDAVTRRGMTFPKSDLPSNTADGRPRTSGPCSGYCHQSPRGSDFCSDCSSFTSAALSPRLCGSLHPNRGGGVGLT